MSTTKSTDKHDKKRPFSEYNEDDDLLNNHNYSSSSQHPPKRRRLSEPTNTEPSDYCETHYAKDILHSIPSNPTFQEKQDIITKIECQTAEINKMITMLTNLSLPFNELNQALSELHFLKQDIIENVDALPDNTNTPNPTSTDSEHSKVHELITMGFDEKDCTDAIALHSENVSIGDLIDFLICTRSVSDHDSEITECKEYQDTTDDTTEEIYDTLEEDDMDHKMMDDNNHNSCSTMEVDSKADSEEIDDDMIDIDELHKLSCKWLCYGCKNKWSLRNIEYHQHWPICNDCNPNSIRIMFDIKKEKWFCPQCIHDGHHHSSIAIAIDPLHPIYIQIKQRPFYQLFRVIQFVDDHTIKIQRLNDDMIMDERIQSDKDMIWSYCTPKRASSSLKACDICKIPIKCNKHRTANDDEITIQRKGTKERVDVDIDCIRHASKWIDYIMNIKRKELRKNGELLHQDYLILTAKYERYKDRKKIEKNKAKEQMNIIESAPMNSRHFISQNVQTMRVSVSASQAKPWTCVRCTYINPASCTNCVICDYVHDQNEDPSPDKDITTQIRDILGDDTHQIAPQRDINLYQISQHPLVLILGPSGSGKSTILRSLHSAFSELITFCDPMDLEWNTDRAIISQFGDMKTEAIIDVMSSIGLNSVPTWLKPFHILSQGEQYRAAMSRLLSNALQRQNQWTVMDEYTSVIDRKTARCTSAAFSKYIRKNQQREIGSFILASTNKDIIRWLQPDMVIVLQSDDKYRILRNPNDLRDHDTYAPDIKVVLDLPPFSDLKQTPKYPLSRDLTFDELKLKQEAMFLGDRVRRLQCKIEIDLNVREVANILDVNNFNGEIKTDIPYLDETHIGDSQWSIGVIAGPSGSGKTASGERLFGRPAIIEWDEHINVCCHFSSYSEFKEKFGAVGLDIAKGLCYYNQLSTGEKHRADICRVLNRDNVIIDEFTSYLNRDLSKIIAANIGAYIRRHGNKRVVLLTCHYDVISYLQPDWLCDSTNKKVLQFEIDKREHMGMERMRMEMERFDVADDCFHRAKIRIYLKVASWMDFTPTFSKYHYMTQHIQANCTAFTCWATFGYVGDEHDEEDELELVGFVSILMNFMNTKFKEYREHRTVILPSFQGMGFGSRISDAVGEYLSRHNITMHSKTAHPRYGRYRDESVLWKATSKNHFVGPRLGMKSQSDRALLGNKWITEKEKTEKKFYSHRYISHLERSEDAQFYLDQRVIVKGEYPF